MDGASRLILIAKVDGAFGVRGDVRLTSFAADPIALLTYRALRREDGSPGLTLVSGRPAKGGLIVRASEVETREEAEALRGLRLYVDRASLPEPDEEEFYLADLIGLRVLSPEGAALGAVRDVRNFGAGDLIEVAPGDGSPSWWVPFTKEAVPDVRLSAGEILIVRPAETSDGAEAEA